VTVAQPTKTREMCVGVGSRRLFEEHSRTLDTD